MESRSYIDTERLYPVKCTCRYVRPPSVQSYETHPFYPSFLNSAAHVISTAVTKDERTTMQKKTTRQPVAVLWVARNLDRCACCLKNRTLTCPLACPHGVACLMLIESHSTEHEMALDGKKLPCIRPSHGQGAQSPDTRTPAPDGSMRMRRSCCVGD